MRQRATAQMTASGKSGRLLRRERPARVELQPGREAHRQVGGGRGGPTSL